MDSHKCDNDPLPDPAPSNVPLHVSSLAHGSTGTSIQVKENDMTSPKHHRGFIFMCNRVTKPMCFQYRVFGLPISQKDVVEKIKPGTKLFLFDVEVKLLYGIYEATSYGKVDIEPTAFGGKFPAQVNFRIIKGSLPLPEKSFRRAITENYQGNKFSPELSEVQVKKLQLLFRPLSVTLPPLPRVPPRIEDRYTPQTRYLPGMQQSYALQVIEPQPVRDVLIVQHQPHAAAVVVDQPRARAQNRSIMVPIEQYYHLSSQPPTKEVVPIVHYQQPGLDLASGAAPFDQSCEAYTQQYSSGGHAWIVQEPFPRHTAVQDTTPYYQTIRREGGYHRLLQQNAAQYQRLSTVSGQSVAPYYARPELNVYGPQAPSAQERETISRGESIAAYYPLPSTVAARHSVSADPYVPSAVAAYYPVPSDPYVPPDRAAYRSVHADPYVEQTATQSSYFKQF